MALLPPSRSPWWLLVFVITAALWTGALLGVRAAHGSELDAAAVTTAVQMAASACAALALLAALGARRLFVGAHVGLLVGYAVLMSSLSPGGDGWADLAGVAYFLLAGAIGLALGAIADIVAFLRR